MNVEQEIVGARERERKLVFALGMEINTPKNIK